MASFLRRVFVYMLSICGGVITAFGVSLFIGLWFPKSRDYVFLGLSILWIYLGWRHACYQDKQRKGGKPVV